MRFSSLIDIIHKAQEKYPVFSLRLAEAEALGRWELAVGQVIAKHARALRVQNSVLFVEVGHPIWRAELHYRKHQILDILNGRAAGADQTITTPQEVLKDIVFLTPRS